MPYRIRQREQVQVAVRWIAVDPLERALADIDGAERDVEAAVHEARKRCKKVRALLRLVRPWPGPTCAEENAWFRDTARRLYAERPRRLGARLEQYSRS